MNHLNELLSIGLVLLAGLLGGGIATKLKIPKVTGYLLIGLLIGPSSLKLITAEGLQNIELVREIALGLILFAIGSEFEIHHFRALGKPVILLTLAESLGALLFITLGAYFFTDKFSTAVLLGAIGIATAPAATLLVIREYEAKGPFTDTILACVAINNIICLITFRIVYSYIEYAGDSPYRIILQPLFEIFASLTVGVIVGLIISYWQERIHDVGEMLLVLIGGILICVGIANTWNYGPGGGLSNLARQIGEISPLIVTMAAGAMVANRSTMHKLIYVEMHQTEQPLYIAFFVLSGAALHVDKLGTIGMIGIAYLIFRVIGKYTGAYLCARKIGSPPAIRKYLGLAIIPQAGVAIGLATEVSRNSPELKDIIEPVILASVIIYETIGPLLTKYALFKSKEASE
jgi:Kef-type K+ transport system membrane component KefB